MEIQKNSRQIPSDKVYTSDKKYSDILYGFLQNISVLEEKTRIRYILKKDISYVKIADILGMHRQTISSKFNNLIKQGLIIYNSDENRYELVMINPSLAALLPNETIRVLCNNLKERSLSILAYLLKTYIQHGEEPCQINLDIIKSQVGLCASNKGYNNTVILDCFSLLQKLDLIQVHKEKIKDKKTGGFKDIYILDKVNNQVIISEIKEK